jgi:protein-serine/threonine kinase
LPAITDIMPSERRTFSGVSMSTNRSVNPSNSQVSQKIKNFFRITSSSTKDEPVGSQAKSSSEAPSTPRSDHKLRTSRFIPHIGRNRSQTVASEGNTLDDLSLTANANPYFAHQGPPAHRHHNADSVPPSPPDTPIKKGQEAQDQAAAIAGKEELARKLRRVASAPNAQGLFSKTNSNDSRPQTSDLMLNGISLAPQHANMSVHSMIETVPMSSSPDLLPVPGMTSPGKIRNAAAFRRTYSSNSIKVRDVEVGPGSFDKIKLIGKGDVGKVYLVREKKSSRLYAMKGKCISLLYRILI